MFKDGKAETRLMQLCPVNAKSSHDKLAPEFHKLPFKFRGMHVRQPQPFGQGRASTQSRFK